MSQVEKQTSPSQVQKPITMERTHNKRKQRRQKKTSTEVQQQAHQAKDFTSRRLDFYLHSLEEEIRTEFKDSEARLTKGQTEERFHLDISVDSLTALLDQLQDKREDDKSETAKRDHSEQDTEILKLHLRKISFMLRTAQSDLKQKTSYAKDLEAKMELLKKENEDLRNEVQAMKSEVRVEKQLRVVAENNTDTMTHGLKLQLFEKDMAEFEARTKAEQLAADLSFERDQTQKLQAKLKKKEEMLVKQKQDMIKTLERAKASHQAEKEEQKAETRKMSYSLKQAESLLEVERHSWQQQKTYLQEEMEKLTASFAAQLKEQEQENTTLVAALQKVEQQLENHHDKWQEEKTSLLEDTEELRKTLREKEQEREKNELFLNSELAALKSQLAKKKRKKKRDSVPLCGV